MQLRNGILKKNSSKKNITTCFWNSRIRKQWLNERNLKFKTKADL